MGALITEVVTSALTDPEEVTRWRAYEPPINSDAPPMFW